MMLGPQPLRPTGSTAPGRVTPPLLFAARISVAMAAPMPCHADRLKLEAAHASTGKMVGQCLPTQLIPAPCRISMPQEYGGIPSRATPASGESPRIAIRCAFSSTVSRLSRSATRCGIGSVWSQNGSALPL